MSKRMSVLQKVEHTIRQYQLPAPPSKVLVALSGGCDSVALLLVMQQLGYEVEAAHCNFHLRGEESERDAQYVRLLCMNLKVELHYIDFDTYEYSRQNGVSIEMAARELRYTWFDQLCEQKQFVAVAVAHHQDDNVETLLLNLLRGSGLRGLTGMRYMRRGVMRPLLDVRRSELEHFLKEQGIDYVTDSTNADIRFKRNRIRHEILPNLSQVNPSVVDTLHQTAKRLGESLYLYEIGAEQMKKEISVPTTDGVKVDIDKLQACPAGETLLCEWLSEYGFSAAASTMIFGKLSSPDGAIFEGATHQATIHRGYLVVSEKNTDVEIDLSLVEGENFFLGGRISIQTFDCSSSFLIPREKSICCIDTANVVGHLRLRNLRPGDRFRPFGMKGTKLLSDFLTDCHLSAVERKKVLVVCDDKGILWVVGYRPDARCAVSDSTSRIVRLEYRP